MYQTKKKRNSCCNDDEGDDTCLECSGAAALRHGSENCENKDAAAAAQIQRDGYDENVDDEDMPATDRKGSLLL